MCRVFAQYNLCSVGRTREEIGRKLKKKKEEDYPFTAENTEWITRRNSPFDFTEYVVRPKF